jgi:hypothetical protein
MPRIDDSNVPPSPRQLNPNGPFQYDGGPKDPVPMPKPDVSPKVQTNERFVSLPGAKRYSYAAYGEKTETKTPGDDKSFVLTR